MFSLVTKKTFFKTIPQTLGVKHEKQLIPAKKSKIADATSIRTHIPHKMDSLSYRCTDTFLEKNNRQIKKHIQKQKLSKQATAVHKIRNHQLYIYRSVRKKYRTKLPSVSIFRPVAGIWSVTLAWRYSGQEKIGGEVGICKHTDDMLV
jgi:hypothetical protein